MYLLDRRRCGGTACFGLGVRNGLVVVETVGMIILDEGLERFSKVRYCASSSSSSSGRALMEVT